MPLTFPPEIAALDGRVTALQAHPLHGQVSMLYDVNVNPNTTHGGSFKNCKRLSMLVKRDTPTGKTPVIILTMDPTIGEGAYETDTHYICVVNFTTYVAARGDPATTYFARKLARPTQAALYQAVQADPTIRASLLRALRPEDVVVRFGPDIPALVTVLGQLQTIYDQLPEESRTALVGLRAQDPQVALQQALCAATTINLESAAHIGALLAGAQSDTIRLIAEAVAANREGRTILNVVNALKLDERLLDAEVTCMEFEELIAHPDTTETMAHNFLKANPWLFGLDYLQTATNVALIRGEADFLLRRSDGFLDLVELKSPDSDIIIERNGGHPTGRNPPPSNFHLSPALANAIAQAHLYRNQMTVEGDALRRQQNIKNTADPRIKIVIGRRANLNDWQSRVLDELNKSLHRVEIIPYDEIATASRTAIAAIRSQTLLAPATAGETLATVENE